MYALIPSNTTKNTINNTKTANITQYNVKIRYI